MHCAERHPDRHGDHHQVLGQRNEAQRHVARPAYAGAFEFSPVDIDRLEHRNRANRARVGINAFAGDS